MSGSSPPFDRRESLRKGVYLLPNLFTTGSLFAGFYGIISTMNGGYYVAAWFILISSIFDGLDGKVARMTDNRVVRARIFPNAPIQKDLPEGMPIFEVGGHDVHMDKVLRLFNALSPSKIQRHDQPKPTLAKPRAPEAKKQGAKQKLEGSLGAK